MKQYKNITLATARGGQGGIATVLHTLESSGFFSRWHVKHIATHQRDTSKLGLKRLFTFLFAYIQTAWTLLSSRVAVAHIHMASRGSYQRKSLLIRLLKRFRVKVVLHLHGAEFREFFENECDAQKQAHIRHTYELADKVIVLSTQWQSWVESLVNDPSKVQVIYNAVDSLQLGTERTEPGLILFLGRLGQRKGVGDLIAAFAEVKKQCPNARLALGGDGDMATFKAQVAELGLEQDVSFLGWISGEQKLDYLARADIYCLPSYNEGFPMGVLEAMSAQKVVVASNAGGIPDALQHQHSGLMCPAGDVKALAQLLINAIGDRGLNARLAANAKQRFEDNFSKQAVIPQLDALYRELHDEH